jgi:hypothetical protein
MNPQFLMLWMIDLLVKDLPGVGYPLLDARIWEHFDVAAPCVVFLSVFIAWIVLFTILLAYVAFLVSFVSTVVDWVHCAIVSLCLTIS